MKTPGIDGYGAKFYKAYWHIIKIDVIDVIQEFFPKGKLFRAFNSTIVTLTPKHARAVTHREFRPIAGCTTFYKIIYKF